MRGTDVQMAARVAREAKPIAADANRMVAKSSERGEPPCDVDPIEELVRIVREDGVTSALAQRRWRF